MDELQQKVVDIFEVVPNSRNDRTILRSVLSDLLPGHKMQVNILMNAFDGGIIPKLSSQKNRIVMANNMVDSLVLDYGITNQAALWSVQTWCYILGYYEEGDLIDTFDPATRELLIPLEQPQKTIPHKKREQNKNTVKHSLHWRRFLLPGFRTGKIWKIIFALMGYACLGSILYAMYLSDKEVAMVFTTVFVGLILFTGNYLDIQRFFPGTKSKNSFVRVLAVLMYDFILFWEIMIIWVIIIKVLS